METIKKDTVKQVTSEIQSLKSVIEDLQVEVKGWKADYSGLVTILKPLIEGSIKITSRSCTAKLSTERDASACR